MMPAHLVLSPLLPPWVLAVAALAVLVIVLVGRRRGMGLRLLPAAVLLLGLANPRLASEEGTPLNDVAVVLVDDSLSMTVGKRARQRDDALAGVLARLKALPALDVRVERVRPPVGRDVGTRLFSALDRVIADIPRHRLAGVVMITDGQVHDLPEKPDLGAPLHVLLAGGKDERDRRLVIEQAPGYGVVGTSVSLSFRIEDPGHDGRAELAIRRDGGAASTLQVPLNQSTKLDFPVDHGGANIVELSAAAVPGELTEANNRAAVSVTGIRDRLRVLLVSGEPHAGERTWRNLLKADPSVDLVHFTILRPPEKDDRTPLKDLALISFPVRELFEEKLHNFDLIIFDRYRRRSVLPSLYYKNIAEYVKGGGALLMAVGPEFASPESSFSTALAEVLPAAPDGQVVEEPFLPRVTAVGRRHPVTAALPGGDSEPPRWGSWMRLIGSRPSAGTNTAGTPDAGTPGAGTTVMEGPGGAPLLVLAHIGEGRVAQLMSDTVWLWARGWEGGGPQAELLRRLAHWLMREPELEEERLTAEVKGDVLTVRRQSLKPGGGEVTVTRPDGKTMPLALSGEGIAAADLTIDQAGLWRVTDGVHVALAASGSLNPVEMGELRATAEKLKPVVEAGGGGLRWIVDGLPDFRRTAPDAVAAGPGWFGWRANGERIVSAVRDIPLAPPWLLLLFGFGGLVLSWWQER
ncbi:MAG TPA: hypothetical protein HPQ04_05710 [Rhodospirillaceae bacterium]|nr:hypothetical protein [Rhodospirillaceae bacterium]